MFKKTPIEKTALDNVIEDLLYEMKNANSASKEEFTTMVDNLVKLNSVKDAERPQTVSYDAIATIVANLSGILLILNHERAGVVASKALSFVSKLR